MNTSQEILLRIKSSFGTSRISISKTATLADLKAEISKKLNNSTSFTFTVDGVSLKEKDTTKLYTIRQFKDGAEIQVNSNEQPLAPAHKLSLEHKSSVKEQDHALTSNCNHPPTARCINCMSLDKTATLGAKKTETDAKPEEKKEKFTINSIINFINCCSL